MDRISDILPDSDVWVAAVVLVDVILIFAIIVIAAVLTA